MVLLGFAVRLGLADANSYWYDEFLSVLVYAADRPSATDALTQLAQRSHHPPLYQIILFYWIRVFGTAEIATRTLSNLYIAGATICLYGCVAEVGGRARAITTAIVFSLLYVPAYYALETRSYAQTIFLVSASSWAAFRFIRPLLDGREEGFRRHGLAFVALVLANFLLLMTHYSNALFFLAEAVFLATTIFRLSPVDRRLGNLRLLVEACLYPLVLVVAIWGPVLVNTAERVRDMTSYRSSGVPLDPVSMVYRLIFLANQKVAALIGFPLVIALAVRVGRDFRRSAAREVLRERWLELYALIWLLLPPVLMFCLFWITGSERNNARYFAFCAPALAILLAGGAIWIVERAALRGSISARLRREKPRAALACLLAVLLAVPGGYAAARATKEDFRGIARSLMDVAAANPACAPAIFETAHQTRATLDFYLARINSDLRVRQLALASDEAKGTFSGASLLPQLAAGGCAVLAFPHASAVLYPVAIARLSDVLPQQTRMLDRRGRGFIIFERAAR